MKLIVQTYNLAGIGREEPTDFPPTWWVEYPTSYPDVDDAVVDFLMSEDELRNPDHIREAVDTMELGADGALYHTDDELTRYSLQEETV